MRSMAIAFALTLLLPAACGDNQSARSPQASEFMIMLTGTEMVDVPLDTGGTSRVHHPVTFELTITVSNADGSTTLHTLDGFVPETYTERGIAVAVSAKKTQAGGTLAVALAKGDTVIATQETSTDYGTVSVSGR